MCHRARGQNGLKHVLRELAEQTAWPNKAHTPVPSLAPAGAFESSLLINDPYLVMGSIISSSNISVVSATAIFFSDQTKLHTPLFSQAPAIDVSSARTLNTILAFFSTGITGGLPMPDSPSRPT